MKYSIYTRGAAVVGSSLVAALGIKIASLFKFSWMVGSSMAFFSGTSVAMPLLGAFGGAGVLLATCLVRFATGSTYSLSILVQYIPGLCAALSWRSASRVLHLVVPIVCLILFVMHPVGSHAYLYTFYWFIPMIIYCMPHQSLFAQAFASTFIAHAVGSVIWLYTVPMPAHVWLALIPVVAVERLMCAAGMVAGHILIKHALTYIHGMAVVLRARVGA